MTSFELAILALALAIDAFSVGSAVGLTCHRPRQIFRLAWHFGLFQALMPLIGALTGSLMMTVIQGWDHWLAFLILLGLGIKMIAGAFNEDEGTSKPADLTRGWSLISLSIAVSIDALAAGVTLPASGTPIVTAVIVIGVVASAATVIGMTLAGRFKRFAGKKAEAFAGLVLIGLGLKILLNDLYLG